MVILLTISSSIDIKKNYFANSCNSNAGSMEVEGFLPSSYIDNIHQGKKNYTHNSKWKKAIQYSYIYTLSTIKRLFRGNRLTWMGAILSSHIWIFFLAARYKGKSSEVTGSNAALFEFNQICGRIVLTTSAFVISWMSFPVAWIAFWSGGARR